MGNSGTVYLHRHIASIKLGRWTDTTEHVHHVDENKLNCCPDNLVVLTSSEHAELHNSSLTYICCANCTKVFKPAQSSIKYCSKECKHSSQIKNKDLTKELLDELIPQHSWVSLGKLFGYSDNGIKKRAKALGCKIK